MEHNSSLPKQVELVMDSLLANNFRCLTALTFSFEEEFQGGSSPIKRALIDKTLGFLNHNVHKPEAESVENGCELISRIIDLDNYLPNGIREYMMTPVEGKDGLRIEPLVELSSTFKEENNDTNSVHYTKLFVIKILSDLFTTGKYEDKRCYTRVVVAGSDS
mmetsp:Transcript_24381/g.37780  ORF Transcript_24381/g.37780 Transcript_24381/m.37780 type:complete len:162 (+) Transcript_24381:1410-1895(+)